MGGQRAVFDFSETWQLVINTGTMIVTLLMVFLVQNTQNRESMAVQLKLDELLRAVEGARDGQFVDLEDRTEQELDAIKERMLAECTPARRPRSTPATARSGGTRRGVVQTARPDAGQTDGGVRQTARHTEPRAAGPSRVRGPLRHLRPAKDVHVSTRISAAPRLPSESR